MAKKTLSDIPIASEESLQALAKLAPEDDKSVSNSSANASPSYNNETGHNPGRWQVERWLEHYNIKYNPKIEAKRTIFRLYECPFDPSHGKYESSVIQSNDGSGPIVLECKHNSCNHTWREWRDIVDGGAKHPEFFENPYPAKSTSPQGTASKSIPKIADRSPFDCALPFDQIPEAKIPPEDVDPKWFFDGKSVNPSWLADYLCTQKTPVFYDGADFYSYEKNAGVYRVVPVKTLRQMAKRALQKHANSFKISNAITLFEDEAFIPSDDLVPDSNYLNLKNGMFHWPTMQLHEHHPKFRSRIQLNASYDLDTEAPRWFQFLQEIFPETKKGKEGWRTTLALQLYFGTCLLPDTRTQKCLFLLGGGSNGKGVLLKTIAHVFNEANVSYLSIAEMSERFKVSMLRNKLLNIGDEIGSKRVETTNFKRAVTGDTLVGENKNSQPFNFVPVAKHIFTMNRIIKVADRSYGFTRRPILIKFNQRFEPGTEKGLEATLKSEADGIFLWMLNGLHLYMTGGVYRGIDLEPGQLYIPESAREDHSRLISGADVTKRFISECCVMGLEKKERRSDIWRAFKLFCEEGNEFKMPQGNFFEEMEMMPNIDFKARDGRARVARYIGLELKEAWHERISGSDQNRLF
jgi:putative DNA primase/helicase